ncbi:MAG: hypothetical protein Q4C72_10500 [Eubacteriales bacterium]|nr:hypothetical protein [Eubacteriales bacterium]
MMNLHTAALSSVQLPLRDWGMLKNDSAAREAQYLLAAPAHHTAARRAVLTDVLHALLADKHVALLAESADETSLQALRHLGADARVLKGSTGSALFAQIEELPSLEALHALPNAGAFRLRFAGFEGTVPSELIFSGAIDPDCPAAITLDCTSIADRPALAIRFDPEVVDECTVVETVRRAVQQHGDALCVDFVS